MPKANIEKTDAPKRATRKRVATSSQDSARTVSAGATRRKAPSTVTAPVSRQKTSYARFYVVAVLLLVAVGGSFFIGQTDSGAIDVTARVNESNQQAANAAAEASGTVAIPVQSPPPVVPASRLRGRGLDASAPTVPAETPAPPSVTEGDVAGEVATSTQLETETDNATETETVEVDSSEGGTENQPNEAEAIQ